MAVRELSMFELDAAWNHRRRYDDRAGDGELRYLTARERDVLAEMAAGLSNTSIATRLHVNLKTIETHISSIFTKLGLTEEASVNRRVVAVLAWLDGAR